MVLSPIEVFPPTGVTWESVHSGGHASYAIDSTGGLWSCGGDNHGQIGNGTISATPTNPTHVMSDALLVSSTAANVAALGGS